MLFLEIVIGLSIGIAIAVFLIKAVFFVVTLMGSLAIFFSRALVALIIGIGIANSNSLFAGYWTNAIFFGVLALGVMYLLGLMPRLDLAIKFLCTAFIAYITVTMVLQLVVTLVQSFLGADRSIGFWTDMAAKVITLGICIWVTWSKMTVGAGWVHSTNPIAVNLQRVAASVLYGLAITMLVMISITASYTLPAWVGWTTFALTGVGMFLADIFVLGELTEL